MRARATGDVKPGLALPASSAFPAMRKNGADTAGAVDPVSSRAARGLNRPAAGCDEVRCRAASPRAGLYLAGPSNRPLLTTDGGFSRSAKLDGFYCGGQLTRQTNRETPTFFVGRSDADSLARNLANYGGAW